MISKEYPQLLRYDMGDGVTAFSTMRRGGVSVGNYASFNINYYCGDDQYHVEANRMLLSELLNLTPDHLVYPHQVHGVEVRQIGKELFSLTPADRQQFLEGADAVMTDLSGVCVGVSTADCIPILLYDERVHAVCAVHAGWRGTVQRIVQHAVTAMRQAFQTDTTHLKVTIGPGISLENFEVGDEVYDRFAAEGFSMDAIAKKYKKWHIDLWECNRLQLLDMGVSPVNVFVTRICTYAQTEDFFSARRLGVNSGRIFSGILLR